MWCDYQFYYCNYHSKFRSTQASSLTIALDPSLLWTPPNPANSPSILPAFWTLLLKTVCLLWPSTFSLNFDLQWPSWKPGFPPKHAPPLEPSCSHPTYLKPESKISILLAPRCCFKQFLSCLPTQIPALGTLGPSSYATFYPSSLLFLPPSYEAFSFPEDPRFQFSEVFFSIPHSFITLHDLNNRVKDLSRRLVPPSFYFPAWKLFLHPSSSATVSHGHMLNPIINGDCTTLNSSSLTSSFQSTYSTLTACIFQTHLDIQSMELTSFLPSITTPHSAFTSSVPGPIVLATQSYPCKYPQLPQYTLSAADFQAKLWHYGTRTSTHNIHIISQYPSSHPSRCALCGGNQEEIPQPDWPAAF